METIELKVTRIGNSRGIRLPVEVLRRYRIGDRILMEQRPDEIVLRPKDPGRLSWEETAREMAASEEEDWSDLDGTVGDGLDEL